MKTAKYYIILLNIIVFFLPLNLFAQEEEKDLMDMSLEELLNLEVTTASKKAQDINFAPADITVITEKMILERGYKDLKDIFRDLPGFDVGYNVEGEVRTLAINRGILGNNKIMVLRDGKKLNVTTGERFVYGNNIPLFNVSRIEIIYGPSSAMYGADAYSGVINLISKKADEIDGVDIEASAGSFGLFDESVLFGKQLTEDFSLMISARKFNSKGFDPTDYSDYDGYTGDDFSQPTDNYNIYATLNFRNFNIGLYRMDANEPNGYGTTPDKGDSWYIFNDSYVWHQVINKAFFDHVFKTNKLNLTSSLEYSDYEVKNESNFNYVFGPQYKYAKTNSIKWEEKLNIDISDNLDFAIGISVENVNSFPKTANLNSKFNTDILVDDMSAWYVNGRVFGLDELEGAPAFGVRNFWKYGVYSELTYKFNENMQVNVGARYDKSSNYDPSDVYNLINPRLGFIWNPGNTVAKILYGEAYIQPSEYDKWENFVAGDFLAHIPNPSLESENLRSFMGIFGQKIGKNFYAELSLFHNSLTDIIRPQPYTEVNAFVDNLMSPDAYIETNSNTGKQTTMGADLKLQFQITSLSAYLNYSYLLAEEENGDPISKITPNKIRAGLTYIFKEKYSISPRVRWFDKANALNASGIVEEGLIDSRFVFDFSVRANEFIGGLSCYLNVLNALNTEYYVPNAFGEGPSGWLMAKAPQPGASFEFGLSYRF